jgi:hypothetical protein
MLKNILIGIFAAILVVALGTAAYNVIGVQAAGGTNPAAAGQGFGGQGGNGQANLASAKTVHGTVSTYSYGTLTIQIDDGQSLGVQLGNSNYATTLGFVPQAGDKLTVYGFTGDEGLFSAITITTDGSGKVYAFRDATTGRPAWAGGGKSQGVSQP